MVTHLSDSPPLAGGGAGTPQLLGQQVGGRGFHQLFQNLLHDTERPVPPRYVQTQSDSFQRWPDAAVVQLTGTRHWGHWVLLERVLGLVKKKKKSPLRIEQA